MRTPVTYLHSIPAVDWLQKEFYDDRQVLHFYGGERLYHPASHLRQQLGLQAQIRQCIQNGHGQVLILQQQISEENSFDL